MFLVTGATGSLGKRIVTQLRENNESVKAFVRLSSNYQHLADKGADIFIGNLTDERDIIRACKNVKYIISTHSSGMNAQALEYRANIDLIDQALANNVEHFVYISVLGADRGYQDSNVFKAKREVEKYLINSGLNYTILRPSGFANNLLPLAERFRDTGVYLLIGEASHRFSPVSTDDLATIAIASVTVPDAKNKIIPVGGSEIIKRGDLAYIFARIFGKDPIIINPPLTVFDAIRGGIGLLNPDLQRSLGTLRTLLAHEFYCTEEEINDLESIYDIKLESFEHFVRRYLVK